MHLYAFGRIICQVLGQEACQSYYTDQILSITTKKSTLYFCFIDSIIRLMYHGVFHICAVRIFIDLRVFVLKTGFSAIL